MPPVVPISRGAPLPPPVLPSQETGVPVARGLYQLGSAGEEAVDRHDQGVLLEARTRMLRAINDAQLEAEQPGRDPEEMEKVYRERVQAARVQIGQEVLEGRGYLNQHLDAMTVDAIESRRIGVLGEQQRRQADASVAGLEAFLDEAGRSIALAKDPADAQATYAEAVAQIDANPYLTEVQKRRVHQGFDRQRDLTGLNDLLETNPDEALRLTADQQAFAVAFPGLDPLERAKFQHAAQIASDAAHQQERELAASNLEIGVAEGRLGVPAIEKAFESELIGGPKRTQLILMFRKLAAKRERAIELEARFRAVMAGDAQYDPRNKKDRKAVNILYDQKLRRGFDALPEPQRSAALGEMVHKIGVVPDAVVSEIQGKLFNGSPAQVVQAADLMDRITTPDPTRPVNIQTLRQFDTEAQEIGVQISNLERAGVPADEAVRRVKERREKAASEIQVIQDAYRSVKTRNPAELEDRADVFVWTDVAIPDALRGDYETLVKDGFTRMGIGSEEDARDSAWKSLLKVWYPTNVNGTWEWMKYAPDSYYGNAYGTEWIRDQLVKEVNQRRPLPPVGAVEPLEPEQIRIQPNLLTAREAASGVPSYTVLLFDEAMGEFVPAPGMERWLPDFEQSDAGIEARRVQASKLVEQRERRAAAINGEPEGLFEDLTQAFASLPRDTSGSDLLMEHWVNPALRAVETAYRTQTAVQEEIGRRGGVGPSRFPTTGEFLAATMMKRRGETEAQFQARKKRRAGGD